MSLEKKVLLINCRSPYLDDSKIYVPLANLYLKSYVEEHSSHQVFLGDDGYDLNCMETFEPYDIIGLSVMTPQRQEALNLLGMIKLFHPQKKVVIGGPHCKYYLNDLVNQGWDHIVNLDGERALLKILNGEASRIVSDVMSKQDILDQPRPDRSSHEAIKMIKNYHYRLGNRNATTMMVARGCPEKCCIVGDTIIHSVEGNIPIKELVGRNIGVLTMNPNTLEVFFAPAINIMKTRNNAELLRIHFDDGTHIDCTPDHLFLAFKNGNQFSPVIQWECMAQDLKPNMSIRAVKFYRNKKNKYVQVSWGRRLKQDIHRLMGQFKIGRNLRNDEVVHHIDGNPKNNHI